MGEFKLRKLEVKVASNKECMAWSDKNTMRWALKDSQVCAGAGVGKDSCKVYKDFFPKHLTSFKMLLYRVTVVVP